VLGGSGKCALARVPSHFGKLWSVLARGRVVRRKRHGQSSGARLLGAHYLHEEMVGRDGIEPRTPVFSALNPTRRYRSSSVAIGRNPGTCGSSIDAILPDYDR